MAKSRTARPELPGSPPPTLGEDDLHQLSALLADSDSVELKLTVPDSDIRSTAIALGMDPLDAQLRQVVFFDTPALDLDRAGVVVRARRIQGKGADTVVKLRPVVPGELPATLRKLEGFGVEVDAMPGGFVCSGRLKAPADSDHVRLAARGELPLRKLFTKQQRRLFAAHAPDGIELDGLATLGPIVVLKLRFTPEGLARRMVAEAWMYPDGSRLLELSTRCATKDTFTVAAETRAFLTSRGVDLSGEQATKTRKALAYFAGAG